MGGKVEGKVGRKLGGDLGVRVKLADKPSMRAPPLGQFCGHGREQPRSQPKANLAFGVLFCCVVVCLLLFVAMGGLGATPRKVSLIR